MKRIYSYIIGLLFCFVVVLPAYSAGKNYQPRAAFTNSLAGSGGGGGPSVPAGYYLRLTNNVVGTDGDLITPWVDVSGNGFDEAQPAESLKFFLTNSIFTGPLNGLQSDGVDDKMATASITHSIGTGDFTWAIKVMPLDATGTYKGCAANGAFSPGVYLRLSTSNWGLYIGGDKPSGNTLSANTKYWLVIRRSSGTLTFWQNGIQASGSFSDSTSIADAQFSVGDDGSGAYAKQIFGEVICWASALTDGQLGNSYFTLP